MDSFQLMLADLSPWPSSAPSGVDHISPLCGALVDSDDLGDGSVLSHSRQPPENVVADPSAIGLASSPAPAGTAGPTSSGPILGRPRQWTVSRSRKLARLYLYSTLSIEKIIKVLEDGGFCPRCGKVKDRSKPTKLTSNQEELGAEGDPQDARQ